MAEKLPSSNSGPFWRLSFADVLVAALAPIAAISLRDPNVFTRADHAGVVFSVIAFLVSITCFIHFRIGSDLARFFSPTDVQRILKASLATAAATAAILFVVTRLEGIPRSLPIIHLGTLFFGLLAHRAIARIILGRQWSHPYKGRENIENILVVGTGELAWFYVRAVGSLAFVRQKIIGMIDIAPGNRGRSLAGHTILGSCQRLDEILRELAVHGVIIKRIIVAEPQAGPGSSYWQTVAEVCAARNVELDFLPKQLSLPGLEDLVASNRRVEFSGKIADRKATETRGANHAQSGATRPYWMFRRFVDLVGASLLIVLLTPLFILVSFIVLLSFGNPLLFWQERMGRFGTPIHVHKFRSMRAPFDRHGHPLTDADRHTPVGRFLRASRLDELPQLFDILRGDMSFIGPRPLLPIDQPPDPTKRLLVRPGLTGWAQIHGGQIITPVEKGALDEWYIDNAGIWLDLKICIFTVRAVIRGDRRDDASLAHALAACKPGMGKGASSPQEALDKEVRDQGEGQAGSQDRKAWWATAAKQQTTSSTGAAFEPVPHEPAGPDGANVQIDGRQDEPETPHEDEHGRWHKGSDANHMRTT